MTVFTCAEALVNSRSLTYQSVSPQDDIPLTSNHLLHEQIGGTFAPETTTEVAYHRAPIEVMAKGTRTN